MNMFLDHITKPTLLVDKEKTLTNVSQMKTKADHLGLSYRPHFKTHQSLEAGRWHKALGISAITVSSVDMATYFAPEWDDITIAFPVNLREAKAIDALAHTVSRLNILVESAESVERLDDILTTSLNLFIKIDTGYHRTGIAHTDYSRIDKTLKAMAAAKHCHFAGFLVHAGHTYDVTGKDDVMQIHQEAMEGLAQLNKAYRPGYPDMIVSYGDTPSSSLMDDFGPVQELRPGNLAYYDVMQMLIGSCTWEQIAVCMACPVVATHPERNEIVVYGGGIHLSKDSIPYNGKTIYGLPVDLTDSGWSAPLAEGYVRKLSQEHGVIKVSRDVCERYRPGDLIGILPVHSCLAVDCIDVCYTLDGDKLDLF